MITEGPIVLSLDQSLFIRSGGFLRNNKYFDESAQNDIVLTNYFKKFNEKAKQEYDNYFNNRKAISTNLINVIKNTCFQWETL